MGRDRCLSMFRVKLLVKCPNCGHVFNVTFCQYRINCLNCRTYFLIFQVAQLLNYRLEDVTAEQKTKVLIDIIRSHYEKSHLLEEAGS